MILGTQPLQVPITYLLNFDAATYLAASIDHELISLPDYLRPFNVMSKVLNIPNCPLP